MIPRTIPMLSRVHSRPRLGLTMVELLISLALLSLITAAGVGWLQTTTARGVIEADDVRWLAAAERTLQRIAESIVVGDVDPDDRKSRIQVTDGALRIVSREPNAGRVTHSFAVETWSHQLSRATDHNAARPLLGDVASWTLAVITDDEDPGRQWLAVEIHRQSTPDIFSRRLRLP